MRTHWILIADASRARILASDELFGDLAVVQELVHPASRMHTSELVTDDRGRSQAYPGGAGTAMDAHTDPSEVEKAAFAREVNQALSKGADEHAYEALVIAAAPKFLGYLRDLLPPRVAGRVTVEIHHDYTRTPLHELAPLLKKHLPG